MTRPQRGPSHCSACGAGPLRTVRLLNPHALGGVERWLCRRCLRRWPAIQGGTALPAPPRHLGAPPAPPRPHRPGGRRRPLRLLRKVRQAPWTPLHEAVELGQKRPRTKEGYLRSVDSFVRSAGTDPAGWTGLAVELWRNGLGSSARTANTYLAGVKYASKRWAALGLGPDFARGVESLIAPLEVHRRPHHPEEARRLVAVCADGTPHGLRDAAMLTLGFRTGLRREGMCTLRFADLGPGRRVRVVLKGGRHHEIQAVDDEVLEVLGAWLRWLGGRGIHDGPVFRSLKFCSGVLIVGRGRLSPGSVNAILAVRARQARVPGFHPHRMRHSFISWAIAAGATDRQVMAVTGQVDPKTLSTYHTDVRVDEPLGAILPSLRGDR